MNIDFIDRAKAIDFSTLKLDDAAVLEWSVEESEIDDFARLSGDRNPLHMSHDFARTKGFEGRVAHGFLLGSKVSALVGMLLPGQDCLILEQGISYPKPIYPGDTIMIEGSISELSTEHRILKVKIRASRVTENSRAIVARGFVLCRSQ
ncbi:MAG: (R)-hydratase [Brevundimonas sp.]|nr:MAG: (R)-hydratase [Brevundimonas sp.]